MKLRKKLIEVALPLEAINRAAEYENKIHTGLPEIYILGGQENPLEQLELYYLVASLMIQVNI